MPSDTTSLFIEHRGSLVDYATRIVGSRAQAEDLVQEAWLRFDEVARKRFLDEPLGYLYRIVRNLALDGRRRASLESEVLAGGESATAFLWVGGRRAVARDGRALSRRAAASHGGSGRTP